MGTALPTPGAIIGVRANHVSTFVAQTITSGGNVTVIPPGTIVTWNSSDPVNAPVSTANNDPTGLTCNVIPPGTAPTSGTFNLSVSATINSVPVLQTITVPYLPPITVPPQLVGTGFKINQTSLA